MSYSDPATGAVAVTPSETVDLAKSPTRALYVGTTGNLKVTMASGDVVTLPNVPVGFAPIMVKRVFVTGTTASDIFALY